MRIITIRKDIALTALASGCGVCEKELMVINGLERSAFLPCGMSLILPSDNKKSEQKTELFVSDTDGDGCVVPSALVHSVSIFEPGEHRADGGALPMLAVSNIDEKSFVSPELAHRLFMDESAAENTVNALAAKLENEGWRGLVLNMEYLFPFDRDPYTAFVEKLEKVVHSAGCWFILALPAEAVLHPHSRSGAAYDVAALSRMCERIILTCEDIWTGESLEECISELSELMPVGKVLLGLKSRGLVRRSGYETHMQSAAAHNLAVSSKARIYRKGTACPAQFDYADAAGESCHVQYTDALWFYTLAEKIKKLGLAGLFCSGTEDLCPGGRYLFEGIFQAEKFL